MELLAVGDKIIARKIDLPTQSAAGVLLPQQHQQRFKTAEVLNVSPTFNTVIKAGDIIRYYQTVFEYEDGIIVLREDHIAAIITNQPKQ